MERKDFLLKGLLGTSMLVGGTAAANSIKHEVDELTPLEPVGLEHLPPPPLEKHANMVVHRAIDRGRVDHGWLQANFSFSFASWHDPMRMHFGVLRVLNDDIIAAGKGFGTHPHDNMEIITIPLEGALQHKDSMGNTSIINAGDIQVMSAGSGILHSEFNPNKDRAANTLQIWLFPNRHKVTPRYQQMTIAREYQKNKFQQILSPDPDDAGVWIHQDAWFHLGDLDAGKTLTYGLKKPANGVYAFVIKGEATIQGQELGKRDALGVWDAEQLKISAGADGAEILLLDVPMELG